MKIFTTLDVNKPIKLPRKDKDTGDGMNEYLQVAMSDFNITKQSARNSREQALFRIKKGSNPAKSVGRLSPTKVGTQNLLTSQRDYQNINQLLTNQDNMPGSSNNILYLDSQRQ